MGGAGDWQLPALRSTVSAFAGKLAHVGAVARRLSTLAAIAAVLVIGLPLASYYLGRAPKPDAARADDDVILVSPRGDTREARPITFVWRRLAEAKQYELTVMADDGEHVFAETTTDTTVQTSVALVAGKEYDWNVSARLANGAEKVSETVRFRIVGTAEERR